MYHVPCKENHLYIGKTRLVANNRAIYDEGTYSLNMQNIEHVVISILTYPVLDSEVSYWVKRVRILIYTRLFLYS